MTDYQARMIEEQTDLNNKIIKLVSFIHSERYREVEKEERERMERQSYIMTEYARILRERITAFRRAQVEKV